MPISKWQALLFAVCFVSGATPQPPTTNNYTNYRFERGAPAPNFFNKLTVQENTERQEKCGRLGWRIDETVTPKWHGPAFYPWVVNLFDKDDEMKSVTAVIISQRHILADSHVVRTWNLTGILDNNITSTGPISSLLSTNQFAIDSLYCTGPFSSGKCSTTRFKASPSRIFVDKKEKPKIVLFEFDVKIPIKPICLPLHELEAGDTVMVQHREGPADQLVEHSLFEYHLSGWAAHKTEASTGDYSQVLVKKESGRFTIAGNGNQLVKAENATIQLFAPISRYTNTICEWTGACPLPRVDFRRLSVEENEARLESCGSLPQPVITRDIIRSTYPNFPWRVTVTRSDGRTFEGVAVSARHVLTDMKIFDNIELDQVFEETNITTITSRLPVLHGKTEVLNFHVLFSDIKTMQPEKIKVISGSYAILELYQDVQVTPICLFGDHYTPENTVFHAVKKSGFLLYTLVFDDGDKTSWSVYKFQLDRLTDILLNERNRLMTVIGVPRTYNNATNKMEFRQWSRQQEMICEATGICSPSMVPLRLKDHEKLTIEKNEKRLRTCGTISTDSNHSPWLVGIRTTANSSLIHTGVIISEKQVLLDGSLFASWEDLSELFGDFESRQPQTMSVEFPKYELPESKFDIEVLVKECVGPSCSSQKEIVMKPSRLLLYDSSNPSVMILQFADVLPGNPVCLQDRRELEKDDTLYYDQYMKVKVILDNQEVSVSPRSSLSSSAVIIRKDGDRHSLAENWGLARSSTGDSFHEFMSMFSLRHQICALSGVCPPFTFPVDLNKISEQEDVERSNTCGRLNPLHHHPDSPNNRTVARDAPWLVGVHGLHTQMHTGAVVSPRHVLMGVPMMEIDFDRESVFGIYYWEEHSSTLPLPRSGLHLKVLVDACVGEHCEDVVTKEISPSKIYKASGDNGQMVLLEFNEDLKVTPLCLPHTSLSTSDELFEQDYLDPESVSRSMKVDRVTDDGEFAEMRDGAMVSYSKIFVKKEDGIYTLAAYDRGKSIWSYANVLFSHLNFICTKIGTCSKSSRSSRDAHLALGQDVNETIANDDIFAQKPIL